MGSQSSGWSNNDIMMLEYGCKSLFHENMIYAVEQSIDIAKNNGDLQTKHFYFIHADCKATVECAVLRFSLDKGVEDVYHKITENDLSGIYEELVTFTNQSSCDNPLFTMMNEDEFADNVRNVYKFLQGVWIAAGASKAIPVYPVEILFSKLLSLYSITKTPTLHAVTDLSYHKIAERNECEVHQNSDSPFWECSMHIVKFWANTILRGYNKPRET